METLAAEIRKSGYAVLFSRQSEDLKRDAQRNLSGRTHYVDDETLRYHNARIVGANAECNGLLYRIVEGVAVNYENTKRGFRFVVFDIFGTVLSRCELEDCVSRSEKAFEQSREWLESFDASAHYRDAFARRAARLAEESRFWDSCSKSN